MIHIAGHQKRFNSTSYDVYHFSQCFFAFCSSPNEAGSISIEKELAKIYMTSTNIIHSTSEKNFGSFYLYCSELHQKYICVEDSYAPFRLVGRSWAKTGTTLKNSAFIETKSFNSTGDTLFYYGGSSTFSSSNITNHRSSDAVSGLVAYPSTEEAKFEMKFLSTCVCTGSFLCGIFYDGYSHLGQTVLVHKCLFAHCDVGKDLFYLFVNAINPPPIEISNCCFTQIEGPNTLFAKVKDYLSDCVTDGSFPEFIGNNKVDTIEVAIDTNRNCYTFPNKSRKRNMKSLLYFALLINC